MCPPTWSRCRTLLNFIKNNGVLLTNHHTPLISHTATDILTTLTGVYGDRHGVPVSNSFRYFNAQRHQQHGRFIRLLDRALVRPHLQHSPPTRTSTC